MKWTRNNLIIFGLFILFLVVLVVVFMEKKSIVDNGDRVTAEMSAPSPAAKSPYEEIAKYTELIKINPKDAKAYCNRGKAYSDQSKYEQAIADYTEAIKINPQFAEAYLNRGAAYNSLGKYEQARKDWEKVVELGNVGLATIGQEALLNLDRLQKMGH